jgi:hypothetical protein
MAARGTLNRTAAGTGPGDVRRQLLGRLAVLPAWCRVAGGLGLGSGLAGCASGSALPAPPGGEPLPVPALRIGDRWRYRRIDRYNGGLLGETLVEVVGTGASLELSVDHGGGAPPLRERWAEPWQVLEEPFYDAPIVFDAPVPVVPPGARTGQRLSTSTRYRSDRASDAKRWSQRLRVVGWERVTVPAGTFDALRIEREIGFEHPDVFRFDAERSDVLWMSPAVGRWVAREWTGTFMPGSPAGRSGRAREDWIRWELTHWSGGPAASR